VLFCVVCGVFFWSCGGSNPGAPGTSGSSDTGIAIRVLSVSHSDPTSDKGDNWQVDLAQDVCPSGTAEVWGDDIIHITFHGEELNPSVPSTNELFATSYSVTFFKINPSNPTIQQISGAAQGGIFIQPGQDSGPFSFLVFDVGRKFKIQTDLTTINNVSTPLLYNMVMQINVIDKFGNTDKVIIERVIEIADYNNC
jgi:hypothetical protein